MFHAEGFERKPTSFHASLIQVVGAAQGSHALSRCTYCTLNTEALTKVGVRVLRGWGAERGGAQGGFNYAKRGG